MRLSNESCILCFWGHIQTAKKSYRAENAPRSSCKQATGLHFDIWVLIEPLETAVFRPFIDADSLSRQLLFNLHYEIFTNVSPELSKNPKVYTIAYIASFEEEITARMVFHQKRKVRSLMNQILTGCNSFLATYKTFFYIESLQIHLSCLKSLKLWTVFLHKTEWRVCFKARTSNLLIWCSYSLRRLLPEQLTAWNKHLLQLLTPRSETFSEVCCLTRRQLLIQADIVQKSRST